jgi:hypothetical protein
MGGGPWWYLLAVPAAAGALVAAACGCPAAAAIRPWRASASTRCCPGSCLDALLAALASLAGGVVLGPEAPLVALGLTLGLMLEPLADWWVREMSFIWMGLRGLVGGEWWTPRQVASSA